MLIAVALAMPSSDRAFRALAQSNPEVVVSLVRAIAPDLIAGDELLPEVADDSHVVSPPVMDADIIARIGEDRVLHLERQGYRDADFSSRLFYYHLGLVVRYRPRRVLTLALWLSTSPAEQREEVISRGQVTLQVRHVILGDIKAETLLSLPATACFAAGADAGSWSDEELCERVVEVLKNPTVTPNQRQMALVAAFTKQRYKVMVEMMRRGNMEPVICEDAVRYGEDVGYERGEAAGKAAGEAAGKAAGEAAVLAEARAILFEILQDRGLEVDALQRAFIEAETSLDALRAMRRAALRAESVAAVLDADAR